jgi:hypothetical protein
MSNKHLKELENILNTFHFIINNRLDGNGYDISETWEICRLDGTNKMHIDFEGLDDLKTLPIEQCYGCKVREQPSNSLYFSKSQVKWKTELMDFVNKIQETGR